MKTKLKGAETGHSLLKRKSEALTKYTELAGSPNRTNSFVLGGFEVSQIWARSLTIAQHYRNNKED